MDNQIKAWTIENNTMSTQLSFTQEEFDEFRIKLFKLGFKFKWIY